ncbi:MAG TPA: M1 family metallopeptidase [Candidatus Doudnabacteria bacterium]|nr:M1 family metallopeptidase [Candidatus Doudnabacteria bacterium]
MSKPDRIKHRLPRAVKPQKYHLRLEPNLADFTFTGSETIQLKILKLTKKLVLHAAEIKVTDAKLVQGGIVQQGKVSYQTKNETVTLLFSKAISGKARLYLNFYGTIGEQLRGLYRSKYTSRGQVKYLATTQFEATDARRAFPCFDEPAHKASFDVEVVVPKALQVVSNTIENKIEPHKSGLKIVKFQTTPKMSTYLLALIIGELEHLKGKSKRGVQIRVHTTPGKKMQGKFALDFTKKALDFLENYFGIEYPLPVLDLIAVPDFGAGAMENWGAITFRETLLLVDEAHSPFTQKQRVAEVIAHELVHQWFGNLVTMEWWTHLWLNESFATYMAYVTVDAIYPDWNYWTKFVLDEQSFALQQDSLHSTHPIEVPVRHPNEIAEIFDAISYAKGASVLRMLANYIGAKNFQAGLSLYLRKHSYRNTSSVDLWTAFESVSGMPVRSVMKAWTTKPGFPVVSASLVNQRILLKQSEFKQLPSRKPSKQLWPIPLPLQTGPNETLKPFLLTKRSQFLQIPQTSQFLNIDYNDSSLTIINYQTGLLAQLIRQLENKTLGTLDRLAIVRDTFLLAKSGHLSTDVYLEILNYLTNEQSYVIWSEVLKNLNQLERLLAGSKVSKNFSRFKRNLLEPVLRHGKLGIKPQPNEIENNSILRGLILGEAGLAGLSFAIKATKQYFSVEQSSRPIPPNLRSAVYSIMAKQGNLAVYRKLISQYEKSDFPVQKQQLLFAIINGATPSTCTLTFDLIYSGRVRDQDQPFAVAASLLNPEIKLLAWKELVKHWPLLHQKFGNNKMLGTILSGAQSFNTEAQLQMFKIFLRGKKLSSAKQAIAQTKEKITINIAWRERDLSLLNRYLK